MPFCHQCGAPNPDWARFCDQCGAQLIHVTPDAAAAANTAAPPAPPAPAAHGSTSCYQCGADVLAGQAFCDNCGAPLLKNAPADTSNTAASGSIPPQQQFPPPQPFHVGQQQPTSSTTIVPSAPAAPPPAAPPAPAAPPPAAPPAPAAPPPSTASGPTSLAQISLNLLESGQAVPLPDTTEVIIGRNDVVSGFYPDIDLTSHGGIEQGVGRRHMRLLLQQGQVHAEDLDSTNGTFVNGFRLTAHRSHALSSGDELRLGNLRLRIRF